VKTAGFEAEYGQSTGGVINVVTQSGTNSFHGSVFGYTRPEASPAITGSSPRRMGRSTPSPTSSTTLASRSAVRS
jgi:hypothetical protein